MAQHGLGVDRAEAIDDRSGDADATHHGGAIPVKVEVSVRLASSGGNTPATAGEGGEALPVPSDADDGDARPVMNSSRPLGEGTEADDGLPSFSLGVTAPENPAGPYDGQDAEGAAPPSPGGGTPSINDGLYVFSLADETRGIGGQDEGTRAPEGDGGGRAAYAGAAGAAAPPPGVVSPPAVTFFGESRGCD